MASTPIEHDDLGYLQSSRAAVIGCLDGLSEYDVRRPMTPTGTNLLGVVKHLIGIEAGYLGLCVGRPFDEPLPWLLGSDPHADLWATPQQSRETILTLYRRAAEHSDRSVQQLPLSTPATVAWWPPDRRSTTLGALLARVLKDTAMHAGQLQILRELIDGRGGSDQHELDAAQWRDHVAHLQTVARSSAGLPSSGPTSSAPTTLVEPATSGSELELLHGFLTFYRAVLRRKLEGLDAVGLRRTLPPSTMTLGGLAKHLAYVEEWWLGTVLLDVTTAPWAGVDWAADPDWDWNSARTDSPQTLLAQYDSSVAAAERSWQRVVEEDGAAALERRSARASSRTGEGHFSLRWILIHLIEEYARHAGHADLLREAIDGSTGD